LGLNGLTLMKKINQPTISVFMQKFMVLLLALVALGAMAQTDSTFRKFSFNGYISGMQSVMTMDSLKGIWINENLIHQRINLKYQLSDKLKASVEIRSRFVYGDQLMADQTGQILSMYSSDRGVMDLSANMLEGKSFVLNSQIDRLCLAYESGKLNIMLGRQRINWGQTFVWNPNDIFNNYSFFDFDYAEKPGSDALRLQYFTDAVSLAEVVVKANAEKKLTLAALYKFNTKAYDIQFLGGLLNQSDYFAGAGWSGNLKDAGFRGEISAFRSTKNFADTTLYLMFSLGLDYTFSNSLMLQAEYLYNGLAGKNGISDFSSYYAAPLTVKDISFDRHNIFYQISYPVSPLINAGISAMVFPKIKGAFTGFNMDYSMAENWDLSFVFQLFSGKFSVSRETMYLAFLRIKRSF
jgi:hypothetical protein